MQCARLEQESLILRTEVHTVSVPQVLILTFVLVFVFTIIQCLRSP